MSKENNVKGIKTTVSRAIDPLRINLAKRIFPNYT
jgi:hypothetical protein